MTLMFTLNTRDENYMIVDRVIAWYIKNLETGNAEMVSKAICKTADDVRQKIDSLCEMSYLHVDD